MSNKKNNESNQPESSHSSDELGGLDQLRQIVFGDAQQQLISKISILRGASAFIIVVDQTRISSLMKGLDIHTLARKVSSCPAILAINKHDLQPNWHWEDKGLEAYKNLFDLEFCTSAKTGENVENMFSSLASLLLKD